MVSLKCPRNSWGTLQMPLINCQIDYILYWSVNCVMSPNNNAYQEKTLANLSKQLNSGFKRTINWKKY